MWMWNMKDGLEQKSTEIDNSKEAVAVAQKEGEEGLKDEGRDQTGKNISN